MTPQTKKWRKKEKMVRKKQTKTFRRRSYVLWYHNPRIKLKKHRYTPLQAHTPKKLTNSSMNLFLLYVAMLALSLPLSFPLSVRLCVCVFIYVLFLFVASIWIYFLCGHRKGKYFWSKPNEKCIESSIEKYTCIFKLESILQINISKPIFKDRKHIYIYSDTSFVFFDLHFISSTAS